MRYFFVTIYLTLGSFFPISQAQQVVAPEDSTQVFDFDQYYELVLAYHPIVRQAALLSQQAAQELRLARGGFDPKLEGYWKRKQYSGTEYYDLKNGYLKIPVWFPVDPKIGIEHNTGEYLNPENYISSSTDNQMLYMGIAIPLGQGLFIDQRRATVKQARLMQSMAENEQVKAINKILLTAAKDYWEWYYAHSNYRLLQRAITIAEDIYERTRLAYQYGEVAAVDTIQALITLQQRETDFQQANIDRIRATLNLSNHLWTEEGAPLELQDNVSPDTVLTVDVAIDELSRLVELAYNNHPDLVKLNLKQQSLQIDRRLTKENLKPKLDLEYALLNQPISAMGETSDITITNDYKLAVNFSMPLFLRKERAKLAQNQLKLQDNEFDRMYTRRNIANDINAQYAAINGTVRIIDQQAQMVDNYERLVEAERFNLQNGESDLFKINAQLDKLIEARRKLLKLQSGYQKDYATLYWLAGIPQLGWNEPVK
ncbi:MAG: TolC family protein [Cyclobacteriaceae bacterium]